VARAVREAWMELVAVAWEWSDEHGFDHRRWRDVEADP
jgi:hypothetical protein